MGITSGLWPDCELAKDLGFLYLGLSGSRAYKDGSSAELRADSDWDFVGMVESKNDIISLVVNNETRICDLFDIVKQECVSWELSEHQEEWEVLRFAGWAKDGSKRSIKIFSKQHFLEMTENDFEARRFGVLSAKVVKHSRRHHPQEGGRVFVFQPTRLTEKLYVLHDADFLHKPGDTVAINPGVTCDLFLTSIKIYEVSSHITDMVKAALIRKCCALSRYSNAADVLLLFYRAAEFDGGFTERLKLDFERMDLGEVSPDLDIEVVSSSFDPPSDTLPGGTQDHVEGCWIYGFFPAKWNVYSLPHCPKIESTAFIQSICGEDLSFRATSEEHHPSAFSCNSEGLFGELRTEKHQDQWQPTFAKKTRYFMDELAAIPDVMQHFPEIHVQQLVGIEKDAGMLFFRRFQGKTLAQIRLDYIRNKSFLNSRDYCEVVEWFLAIEMSRAEHVSDAYSRTLNMQPDATNSTATQRIHRFYYERLVSDVRFLEFYPPALPFLNSPQLLGGMTASDMLNLPLIINGEKHNPLRYHLDRARDTLNPRESGILSSLPIVFGLGDGHGGNIMVTEQFTMTPETMYIDYEVSGFHCPFLDMAKSLYNDAFFNILYADLLCDDLSDESNPSRNTVSWELQPEGLYINYAINVDAIVRAIALTKLEFVLLPLVEEVRLRDPAAAVELLEQVLGYSLFCCAVLSRNFTGRPDVFFLNLALGVRLASSMGTVFSEIFDWHKMSIVKPRTHMSLVPIATQYATSGMHMAEEFLNGSNKDHWLSEIFALISSSFLTPEEVFLKRSEDTIGLHRSFSQDSNESSSAVIQRISEARYLGMKVSPHTCIRESIFAEPRIDHHFAYKNILSMRSGKNLLVDVGCCMGTDIRKLVFDGYPPELITGLDLESRYFQIGHKLYNEPATRKLHFLQADMLSSTFTSRHASLKHKFHLVHTANVIHLFDLAGQTTFFANLLFLAKPGGVIWGRQVGLAEDENMNRFRQPEGKGMRFTIREFREFCSRMMGTRGWENEGDPEEGGFEAQLVRYDEIRDKRVDKQWVLQWRVDVPRNRPREEVIEILD